MRSDLDALRERHVERETREELFGVRTGDWGWARAHVQTVSHRGHEPGDRSSFVAEAPRPGTNDGGF